MAHTMLFIALLCFCSFVGQNLAISDAEFQVSTQISYMLLQYQPLPEIVRYSFTGVTGLDGSHADDAYASTPSAIASLGTAFKFVPIVVCLLCIHKDFSICTAPTRRVCM